ncbi:MAG: sodium-dependent transporter, partial [Bacteroidales bacterium]|nr:sodium-dependent transporter [Bacteroidales bacterium]
YSAIAVFVLCVLSSESLHDNTPLKLFGMNVFNALDTLTSKFLMTIGGLLTVIFVGWKMKKAHFIDEYTNGGNANMGLRNIMYFIIKFLAPVAILIILITKFIK